MTYTIEQKQSNTGSIHDLASDMFDRQIVFGKDCKFAVVKAAYYGGKGYSTHRTAEAAARESARLNKSDYSHSIIDSNGDYYNAEQTYDGWQLRKAL